MSGNPTITSMQLSITLALISRITKSDRVTSLKRVKSNTTLPYTELFMAYLCSDRQSGHHDFRLNVLRHHYLAYRCHYSRDCYHSNPPCPSSWVGWVHLQSCSAQKIGSAVPVHTEQSALVFHGSWSLVDESQTRTVLSAELPVHGPSLLKSGCNRSLQNSRVVRSVVALACPTRCSGGTSCAGGGG